MLSSPQDVIRLLRWSSVVALDLETTGLNPRRDRIRLMQFSNGAETMILDCFEHDVRRVLPWLADKILVAHNAAFDLGFLWHAGLTELPETICTYLLGQLLTAGEGEGDHGFPKLGLGACTKRWLNRELDKELQTSDWSGPLSEAQLTYARQDVEVLLPLLRSLNDALQQAKLVEASEIELRALRAFVWMGQQGVPFDRPAWKGLADQAVTEQGELEQQLSAAAPIREQGLFGDANPWNWNSPKQMTELLDGLARRKGVRVYGTNDATLAELDHPVADLLRRHRVASKRATTYGHDWLQHVAADGRVYPGWRQIGAASGRTSCSNPNMQQLPREGVYRACVRASEGRTLIKADYSQIELRLACKIARERKMLEAYRTGQDLHVLTASLLLGKPVDQVTKDDRQIAKSANFGLLYGMGARGYKVYCKTTYGLDLSEEKAEHYRTQFFRAYPGLSSWHSREKYTARMETRTLAGRRRLIGTGAPDTWKLNTPVQGSGADGLKRALGLLWDRRAEQPGAFPVLAVHDEIVVECAADQADAVKAWVIRAMEDGIRDYLDPVPVEVDAKVKPSWGG